MLHITETRVRQLGSRPPVDDHGWVCRCGDAAWGYASKETARRAGDAHLQEANA